MNDLRGLMIGILCSDGWMHASVEFYRDEIERQPSRR